MEVMGSGVLHRLGSTDEGSSQCELILGAFSQGR